MFAWNYIGSSTSFCTCTSLSNVEFEILLQVSGACPWHRGIFLWDLVVLPLLLQKVVLSKARKIARCTISFFPKIYQAFRIHHPDLKNPCTSVATILISNFSFRNWIQHSTFYYSKCHLLQYLLHITHFFCAIRHFDRKSKKHMHRSEFGLFS